MQSEWERPAEIEVASDQVREVLRNADASAELLDVRRLSGGRRNSSYLLEYRGKTGHSRSVLKLYADIEKPWWLDAALYDRLGASVPMPRVVAAGAPGTVLAHPWVVFELVEGVSLDLAVARGYSVPKSVIEHIARTLARIHEIRYEKVCSLSRSLEAAGEYPPLRTWYSLLTREHARAVLGPERWSQVEQAVNDYADFLDSLDREPVLAHGDFRPANLLVAEGRLTAVLDWEDAMAGHWLADLGQFIRDPREIDDRLREVFVRAYQSASGRELPRSWRAMAYLRDLVHLLQMLESSSGRARQQAGLLSFIDTALDRLAAPER